MIIDAVTLAIVGFVVLLLVLLSVAALIWRIWAVSRQYAKLNDRTPTLSHQPDGWMIDIPVTVVSGVWLSMPGVASSRSTGWNEFRITLVELSQHCRLTPRARQWIGPSPAPPVYASPAEPPSRRSGQQR